ncbi:MAG: ATP-binding protein [Desulfobacteraceae bacterium]|nr:ATP-binding protein [Desulfobacteraceae bacterium]MBC2718849.1 ATP-binding protein [Desulfobacteraceae bacterium]
MANPFIMRVIPSSYPFADRIYELKELSSHARNKANVVVFAPRRYGKTSLVKKIQANLKQDGFITIYTDFFMVASVDDVAERIARSVYSILHKRESFLQKGSRYLKIFKTFRPVFKPSFDDGFTFTVEPVSPDLSGIYLLDKVLEELGEFIHKESSGIHIVFDEFQEITDLKERRIEGIIRKHIQTHQTSYFFVGSRRRILLDIFNQRNRPFYQSAIIYPLEPLPHEELKSFLVEQFKLGGKNCSRKNAEIISSKVVQYPYYAQSLAYNVYETAERTVTSNDIEIGFEKLISSERYGYEGIVQGLTRPQILLLKALAVNPCAKILSTKYMKQYKLSIGGIQYAQKKLERMDLIEKKNQVWQVVDPVFRFWLGTWTK